MAKLTVKNQNRTRDLVMIAMFVTLITLGAFIRFPLGNVPVSMQFAFCLLATLILGGSRACACVLIYIAMGLLGLPVFVGGGGVGYVLQPSFGYLIGFLLGALVGGAIARGLNGDKVVDTKRSILSAVVFLMIVYSAGCGYMYAILNLYLDADVPFGKVLVTGCAIFLPFDTVWCVVMSVASKKISTISRFSSYRRCGA